SLHLFQLKRSAWRSASFQAPSQLLERRYRLADLEFTNQNERIKAGSLISRQRPFRQHTIAHRSFTRIEPRVQRVQPIQHELRVFAIAGVLIRTPPKGLDLSSKLFVRHLWEPWWHLRWYRDELRRNRVREKHLPPATR